MKVDNWSVWFCSEDADTAVLVHSQWFRPTTFDGAVFKHEPGTGCWLTDTDANGTYYATSKDVD